MAKSVIDSATVQAYKETEYRVLGHPGFILRVGHPSADLTAAHRQHRVDCSAFLTACNPFSQAFDAAANVSRQLALAGELERSGLAFVPGVGQHPAGGWPGEDSFLIFGLSLEAAKSLGERFEQNAFIWSAADAVPQLILLR